jgi:hypothetical protein
MGIFRHGKSSEYLTHFHASHGDGWAVLAWDIRDGEPREVIVFRSKDAFADESALPTDDPRQKLVYQGADNTSKVQDTGLIDDIDYYYSIFVMGDDGDWHEELKTIVKPKDDTHWKAHNTNADSQSLEGFDKLRHGATYGR